jgi:hypothetical protein
MRKYLTVVRSGVSSKDPVQAVRTVSPSADLVVSACIAVIGNGTSDLKSSVHAMEKTWTIERAGYHPCLVGCLVVNICYVTSELLPACFMILCYCTSPRGLNNKPYSSMLFFHCPIIDFCFFLRLGRHFTGHRAVETAWQSPKL